MNEYIQGSRSGVLPPIWPGEGGISPKRSPYSATLTEVVDNFAISNERKTILDGLLEYRRALYAAGIVRGFQWLDGSFMEDVELHQSRSPNDIDVVTYFVLPDDETESSLLSKAPHLFDREGVKAKYKVDSYYGVLGQTMSESDVRKIAYWYSMWSHNRNQTWKGFVRTELNPSEDENARLVLNSKQVGP